MPITDTQRFPAPPSSFANEATNISEIEMEHNFDAVMEARARQAANPPRHRRRSPARDKDTDFTSVLHWDDPNSFWDYIALGPYSFSGTVRIEGDGPKLSVDRRKKKGAVHTKLISNGYDTTELQIILRLWEEQHLRDFEELVGACNPKHTGVPFALDVYHPALELAKIRQVMVYGVGFLKPTGTQGLFECTLRCFEFIDKPTLRNATTRVTGRINEPAIDPFFHTNHDNPRAAPTPSGTGANP